MICPFCREIEVGDETGPSTCPACKAGFEIDDRGECIFLDTDNPRIPVGGLICVECGLVQQIRRDSCIYCLTLLNKTVH